MIRLRTGRSALLGALIATALVLFLPMRLALGWFGLGEAGLSARSVEGSLWAGHLTDASIGGLALGDVDARLSPFALLVGEARVVLDRADGLHGAIGIGRHGRRVEDLTAALPTGRLFAPLPVTRLNLADVTIRFVDGRCDRAEGRVTATLVGDVAGIPLPAAVSGDPRCDGEALLLPLASQAGSESVLLRLDGTGRYTAAMTLATSDPAATTRLLAAGFTPGQGGYRLSVEGRLAQP